MGKAVCALVGAVVLGTALLVHAGDLCRPMDTGFSGHRQAIVCYAGTGLLSFLAGSDSKITTNYLRSQIQPYLGGMDFINALSNDSSSNPECTVCRVDTALQERLLNIRASLTTSELESYDSLHVCPSFLADRVVYELVDYDDPHFIRTDNDHFHIIVEGFKDIFASHFFNDSSCPVQPSSHVVHAHIKAMLMALGWGSLSASSFVFGAATSFFYTPSTHTIGMLMGFGNGALLAALSVEMFANSALHFHTIHEAGETRLANIGITAVMLGSLLGCLGFIALNRRLNSNKNNNNNSNNDSFVHAPPSPPRTAAASDGALAPAPSPVVPHRRLRRASSIQQESLLPHSPNNLSRRVSILSAPDPEHDSALSVWLGVLMDGVPEAMVIGFMTKQNRLSFGFLVGVFLSNFPEALGAACLMRHKYSRVSILMLWGSLVAMTGSVAGLTALVMPASICTREIDWELVIQELVEGMAAGAMLCMLSCVAIPESFHMADDYAGLLTMVGFLCTLGVTIGSGDEEDFIFLRCSNRAVLN